MKLFKNLFGSSDEPIRTNEDFWTWFVRHEKKFFKMLQQQDDMETNFFSKVQEKLSQLPGDLLLLVGKLDEDTIDLVITADGVVKSIVFAEELAKAAPVIPGWKISALKAPLHDLENMTVRMGGLVFTQETLSFYSSEDKDYPDQVDITIVARDLTADNREAVSQGTYVFIDHYLGELTYVEDIDLFRIVGPDEAEKELIPIAKLKDFLTWRKKEFVEKYVGAWYSTENDKYSAMEAELEGGKPLIAIINTTLLNWDRKASHSWIVRVDIAYTGEDNDNMPGDETYKLMDRIEDDLTAQLRDNEGYLNVGRQTADGVREIYFACKDYRKPSKVLYDLVQTYADRIGITYDVYKDKYWQSFERFQIGE